MNVNCPICAQPLRPDGFGVVTLGARGTAWVRVHEGNCQDIAMSGVRTAMRGAVYGIRTLLARKAPVVSRLVEDFAAFRRNQAANQGRVLNDGR